MHKMLALIFAVIFMMCIPASAEGLHTREDIRDMYAPLVIRREESPYLETPVTQGDYAPGSLTEAAISDAVAYLNFIRKLAYLEGEVGTDALYTLRAQHAAVLLAANDKLAHDSPRAVGMSDGFYQTAYTGTMSSNIAAINWMDNDVLIAALDYFVRDDGVANLSILGHRRWLLSPYLGKTGFGLANSATGMSYTAMYAHDFSHDPGAWDNVKWPSEGAFPADMTSADIPWSVTLNPAVYADDFSNVTVAMYEQSRGPAQLAHFSINAEAYGAGPCIIFMPDLAGMGLVDYQQNQVWHVRIDGLRTVDGGHASMEYTVEMVSLYPIDPAAVEVSPRALEMKVGDICLLAAAVVPEWADDISVIWSSSDEAVAIVDENGYVTAVGEGRCDISATAVNGRSDICAVGVSSN